MDRRVIEEKLESLRKCVHRIENKRPDKISGLNNDLDKQDILSVNLERAVQLCVDIGTHIIAESNEDAPTTMAETFDALYNLKKIDFATAESMKKAVGFRNVAVHNYRKINWDIVFAICHNHLDDFKAYARQVAKLLD